MNFINMTYEQFENYKNQVNHQLIIYGAGGYGRKLLKCFHNRGIHVDYFCDKNVVMKGTCIEGIKVLNLLDIKDLNGDIDMVIGINSVTAAEIEAYLSVYKEIRVNVFDLRNFETLKRAVEAVHNNEILSTELIKKLGIDYLFELRKFIANTDIKDIIINQDNVIVNFTIEGKQIIICEPEEMYSTYLIREIVGIRDEIHERRIMLKLIEEGSCIFDIGANMGYYSILYNKIKNADVYSFEPICTNFEYMVKNFELNNISRKNIFNIGLSDKNQYVDFYYNKGSHSAASMRNIVNLTEENLEIINCELKTMDSFCEENHIKGIDFIKCDAEGSELLIYKGAIETLKKFRPLVFSELCEHHAKMFGYHPNEVIELFQKMDYLCMDINPFNGTVNFVKEILPYTPATNFLFVPIEIKDHILNTLKEE